MAAHQLLALLISIFAYLAQAQSSGYDYVPDSGVDNVAGASGGDSSSFNLSKGGIIAISVVVGAVVILGITTAVLFVIAKRRQWEVRKSIQRMSRRLTGRAKNSRSQRNERAERRRGTVRLDSPSRKQTSNKNVDVEKGTSQKKVQAMEVIEKDSNDNMRNKNKWDKVLPQGWSVGGSKK